MIETYAVSLASEGLLACINKNTHYADRITLSYIWK